MKLRPAIVVAVAVALSSNFAGRANAQSFGVELNNTLMQAAGGMGGVSIARPQDLTSAMNANPATLTQFRGTQFTFGGAWAEPTFNLTQTAPLLLVDVDPYSAKSTAPGSPLGNIGVTQDLSELGVPATLGLGFVTVSGAAIDFRQVPESNGTNTASAIFAMPMTLGVDLTERLHAGTSLALGIAYFDAPFVKLGGMTPDYALRGTAGLNYDLTDRTNVGTYYQTEQSFTFDNSVRFVGGRFLDVNMDLPQNIGVGVANNALADGRLLIAVDFLYKLWDEADLYSTVYENQFVVQVGTQFSVGRVKLRAGYNWAENPLDPAPEASLGGVTPPGGIPSVRYTQGLLAVTSEHRISGGIGIADVLPGIDVDLMAGGMFHDSEDVGPFTTTSIESYWIGFGTTWRFGRGSCEKLPVKDSWGAKCCSE